LPKILTPVITAAEPFGASLTFTYDAVGNRTSVTDSFGGSESSVYDAANELTSRSFAKSGTTVMHVELAYFTDGRLQEQRGYGSGSTPPEITLTDYTYKTDGRIDTIVEQDANGGTSATNSVNSFSYSYDHASRITSKTENGTITLEGYDYTNQITTINGTPVYAYDATGNTSGSTSGGGVNVTTGNELQTDGNYNYTYDNEGNLIYKVALSGNSLGLTAGNNWTYSYDNRNRLVKAEHRATVGGSVDKRDVYIYDALNNRIEKDVGTASSGGSGGSGGLASPVVTRFAYDLWKNSGGRLLDSANADVWADLNGSSSLVTRYMHGDAVDQVFARMAYSGSTYTPSWLFTDNLGSIRNVVDSTGHVVKTVYYDVFGNITSQYGSGDLGRYAWTGRELDVETGLQYNRARYYDATTRRWMGQDPLGFDAGDSNLYRYVNNQPTGATDPSGFQGIGNREVAGVNMDARYKKEHPNWKYDTCGGPGTLIIIAGGNKQDRDLANQAVAKYGGVVAPGNATDLTSLINILNDAAQYCLGSA
jgi:RHS repeat-associated protein